MKDFFGLFGMVLIGGSMVGAVTDEIALSAVFLTLSIVSFIVCTLIETATAVKGNK